MTSMIDMVTRDFQKYLDDFHEKISTQNFTQGFLIYYKFYVTVKD